MSTGNKMTKIEGMSKDKDVNLFACTECGGIGGFPEQVGNDEMGYPILGLNICSYCNGWGFHEIPKKQQNKEGGDE